MVTPQPMPDPPALDEPMQVSVNVVVKAGAYTVGADLMSAWVLAGLTLLTVRFWAFWLFAAPFEALEVESPPVALASEAVFDSALEFDLDESGPTVTPPLFADEPPLTTELFDPEFAPEVEVEVEGPTWTPPFELLLPWL